MTIKILMISPTQGEIGGIEQFFLAVSGFLKSDPNFELRLIAKTVSGYQLDESLRELLDALGLRWTTYQRPMQLPIQDILWADVVYVQNPIPEVCFLAYLFRKRLVVTIHNFLLRPYSIQGLRWRLAARLASVRWYNSQFVRSSWETAPPSARSEAFPTVSNMPMRLSPLAGRKGFVFISRWVPNKGIEELLEAYRNARIDRHEWPLTMMGSGVLLRKIKTEVAARPITGLSILGRVSEAEKHLRIGAAKWLIAPPSAPEDMGLTPLEARSQGVPCIVTNSGGLPEVCGPGSLIVTPGNVHTLIEAIEKVGALDERTYEEIVHSTFDSLNASIRVASFYRKALHEIN